MYVVYAYVPGKTYANTEICITYIFYAFMYKGDHGIYLQSMTFKPHFQIYLHKTNIHKEHFIIKSYL